MPVTLSIKNAPDDIVRRLKERAARNHRSLQGEVIAILEDAVGSQRKLTIREVLEEVRRDGVSTPSESVEIIRHDRDTR
ncbi:MAG: Arc family DNA-binding protein [Alphaproteobacteria bacterium]